MTIKKSACKADFQDSAKKFVINMVQGSERTLHIKNKDCCQWSDFIQEYVDFDTEEDVELSGIVYRKCKKCFGNE